MEKRKNNFCYSPSSLCFYGKKVFMQRSCIFLTHIGMKHSILIFSLSLPTIIFSQGVTYSVSEGSALGVSVGYEKQQHETLDGYFHAVSDSLQLTSPIQIHSGIPFGFEYVGHGGVAEFEGGMEFLFTSDIQASASGGTVKFTNNRIGVKAGCNIFPIRFAFAGFSIMAHANTGKILATSTDTVLQNMFNTAIEDQPGELSNPFTGYSFTLRLQAGVNIPISKEKYSVIRLTPFYDLGLSEYNFYNAFDQRLKNYAGEENTKVKGAGVRLSILFGLNG
jgi:hypothetical protein